MPLVEFSPENKATSYLDYPKLTLEKGERARIVCIEDTAVMEYVHTLRAPQLLNGKPVYEEVNKFGRNVTEMKTDFINQHLCFGDFSVLQDKGVDAERCPACKASKETDAIDPPKRRYAMHVIKYKTVPGSFTVATPFSVELVAWVYADNRFNTLVDIRAEWEDLKKRDLNLGPCENKGFQKYEIAVANKCEWLVDEERKRIVAQTYKDQQSKDLVALIGRKITVEQAQEDIEKVLTRHRIAFGQEEQNLPSSEELERELGLSTIFGQSSGEPPFGGTEEHKAEIGESEITITDLAEAAAPVKEEPSEPAEADFEDLLKDL